MVKAATAGDSSGADSAGGGLNGARVSRKAGKGRIQAGKRKAQADNLQAVIQGRSVLKKSLDRQVQQAHLFGESGKV